MLWTTRNETESYEVYDDHGNSVGRVVLPKSTGLFEADRRTVYLRRAAPSIRKRETRAA